jgi:hypothetical protein
VSTVLLYAKDNVGYTTRWWTVRFKSRLGYVLRAHSFPLWQGLYRQCHRKTYLPSLFFFIPLTNTTWYRFPHKWASEIAIDLGGGSSGVASSLFHPPVTGRTNVSLWRLGGACPLFLRPRLMSCVGVWILAPSFPLGFLPCTA